MSAPAAQGLLLDQFIQVFWTPYDPLDLASGSLDPLGFARGYLALADRFLPSFTTVTIIPRYTSMLCAAIARAQTVWPQDADGTSSKLRQERLRAIKSFERAWGLACGLAAREDAVGEQAVQGLRGIRSINRRLDSLSGREKSVTTGSFSLLTNQVRYGGLGVYSTFLDECHLASMHSLSLRPLGERLALAFPEPGPDLPVHDEDARLSLDALKEWGIRSHTSGFTNAEGTTLAEALFGGEEADHADHVRWNSLRMLARLAPEGEYEEGALLLNLARTLDNGGFDGLKIPAVCQAQVSAALHVLEPFERFYQGTVYLFDGIRAAATDEAEVSLRDLAHREVVREAVNEAKRAGAQLREHILEARPRCPVAAGEIEKVLHESGILALVGEVLQETDAADVMRRVLKRHDLVQSGKFDKGVRKAPWVQLAEGSDLARLTAQRHQIPPNKRPERWRNESRHPYRTDGALSFIRACKIR